MQKDSKSASIGDGQREAFSLFVKNQALKILDDYVLTTGRKWQAIRSEIINVTGAEATEGAPILTRQDLESWAARKSNLGDIKFKLVFEFLTHPDTLARPEFAKAGDLVSFGAIERVGGAFEDFFDDHAMSEYIRRAPLSTEVDEEIICERMTGFEGCFTGSNNGQDHCLSIERFSENNFFICHLFSWPINALGEMSDWDIDRLSGFCTIGNQVRLHTKNIMISTTRDMYVVPKIDPGENRIETINVILHSLIFQSIENVVFDKFDTAQGQLRFIDPMAHSLILQRTADSQLADFIDQFRWNIVL